MISLEVYESFLIKLNRGDSNSNINVPKGKFVIIYNEQAKRWLKQTLKKNLGSYEIEELNYLLVNNYPLVQYSREQDHYNFTLPSNFFDFSSSFSEAKRGQCSRILDNWPVVDKNIRVLLRDANYSPSFDFEETLCSAVDNRLKIYYNDFKIESAYLTYYREPINIDIKGYIKVDGTQSKNIDPDLPDYAVSEIINRCVVEFQGVVENPQGFQISKDRITTE